jgi:CRP-like cAMP-binding protein
MNRGLEMLTPSAQLIELIRPHADRAGLWRSTTLAKGRSIENPPDASPRVVIVTSGLVKLSFITPEGDERIKAFIGAHGLFDQCDIEDEPVIEATCIEATQITALPLSWVRSLASACPEVQHAIDGFWLWLSAKKRVRESALLCSSPLQRYLALQAAEPALFSRLSQGDIARYVGITPIAFSRLKRRLQAQAAS